MASFPPYDYLDGYQDAFNINGIPTAYMTSAGLYFDGYNIPSPKIGINSVISGQTVASDLTIQGQQNPYGPGGRLVLNAGNGSTSSTYGIVRMGTPGTKGIDFLMGIGGQAGINFSNNATSILINQTASAVVSTGTNFTISGQQATGPNAIGGSVLITSGSGAGGQAGQVALQINNSNVLAFDGYATQGIFSVPTLAYQSAVLAPKLTQSASSIAAGQNLNISAQGTSFSGANGGSLYLSGGAAGSGGVNGDIRLCDAGATGIEIIASSTSQSSYNVVPTATSVAFRQNDLTTAGTGATWSFTSQNSTSSGAGGAVIINTGTGTTNPGNILLQNGGTTRTTISPAAHIVSTTGSTTGIGHLSIRPTSSSGNYGSAISLDNTGMTAWGGGRSWQIFNGADSSGYTNFLGIAQGVSSFPLLISPNNTVLINHPAGDDAATLWGVSTGSTLIGTALAVVPTTTGTGNSAHLRVYGDGYFYTRLDAYGGASISNGPLKLDGYNIDITGGALTGQGLVYNGTSFIPTTLGSGSGTVTSVATTSRLTGGPITASGTLDLATSGVTAGSYGSATQVPSITVDAYGRLTAASNTTIQLPASQVNATSNQVVYGSSGTQTSSSNLTFNGSTLTLTGALTQAGGAVSITSNAASTFTTSSGANNIDSAASLNLGTSTATGVVIGSASITTALASNQVNLGPGSGSTNLLMTGTTQSANDTAGVGLTIQASNGGAASATVGGAGGSTTVKAASGGNGTGALNPGAGGVLTLQSGTAGTGGTGNANSGSITLNIPAASGTGSQGQYNFQSAGANKVVLVPSTAVFAPSTTNTGGLGNSSAIWNQVYSTSVVSNSIDTITGTTLFLGSTTATATAVGSANTITYLGGSTLTTGTGNIRTFNPFYTIGSAATSGTPSVNSPFQYLQANFWNGTATTTYYSGLRTVVNSSGAGYMDFGVGFASPNSAMRLDAYGNLKLLAAGGLDTIAAGALNIGASTATSIVIGKTGLTTTNSGHLSIDGYTIDMSGGAVSSQILSYNGTSFVPTTFPGITGSSLAANQITYASSSTAITSSSSLTYDGSNLTMNSASGAWSLTGGATSTIKTSAGNIFVDGYTGINFRVAGTTLVDIGNTASNQVTFNSAQLNPKITQATTSSATTAAPLQITAQSTTATTSTGGALNLSAGTGTTNNGLISFQQGGTNGIQISPSATGQSLYAVVAGPTSVLFKQTDNTTASATGATWSIQAQNATGTTATGGTLTFTSGTGTTVAGNINLQTGGSNKVIITPTNFTVSSAGDGYLSKSISAPHILGAGSAPTCVVGSAAQLGTSPSATINASSTDFDGYVSFTSGTSPSQFSGTTRVTIATITFSVPYTAAPKVVQLFPQNTNAAVSGLAQGFNMTLVTNGVIYYVDYSDITTTSFKISAISQSGIGVAQGTIPASTSMFLGYMVGG